MSIILQSVSACSVVPLIHVYHVLTHLQSVVVTETYQLRSSKLDGSTSAEVERTIEVKLVRCHESRAGTMDCSHPVTIQGLRLTRYGERLAL